MFQQQIHQTKPAKAPSSGKRQATPGLGRQAPTVQTLALQPALVDPRTAAPQTILHLQRAVGNRVVGDLLAGLSHPLQTKLTVGPAGDIYEQEADFIADQVMSRYGQMSVPTSFKEGGNSGLEAPNNGTLSTVQRQDKLEDEELQAKPLAEGITPLVRRDLAEDEELQKFSLLQRDEEDEELQEQPLDGTSTVGRAGGEAGAELETALQSAKGGGITLDNHLRRQMEGAFGADFSQVRVHTGGGAHELNRSLQSRAFTTGRDLFFRQGEYNPGTSEGQRLIAHELTHVVQQNGAMVKRTSADS